MPEINVALVRKLIDVQFPVWAHLPVRPVAQSGWDNRTFRLGDDMLVRLPSAPGYAAQVVREQRWLPVLRSHLPIEIPEPLACGAPGSGYPFAWSIYRWIEGETLAAAYPVDVTRFVRDLALFLRALRAVSAEGAPPAGPETSYRGGDLAIYDAECRAALAAISNQIDLSAALAIWDGALATRWDRSPVWLHGDVAPGNMLLRNGKLAAVIDFGQCCVGDPACDLAFAWTSLRPPHRRTFLDAVGLDSGTELRGKAWALWKAAILVAGAVHSNAVEASAARTTLAAVLGDV
jgi:aminoglycoside phosphotransferase (APT) family kinase protein